MNTKRGPRGAGAALGRAAMLCLMITAFGGCSDAKNDRTDIPATSPSAEAAAGNEVPSPASSDAVRPQAGVSSHQYVLRQDGAYGYEPALSEDDIRAGKAVKALVMMRYVGFRDGTHTLLIVDEDDPGVVGRVTCAVPCEFAKFQTVVDGKVTSTETLRMTPGSLIGSMFEDAIAGRLVPYRKTAGSRQRGKVAKSDDVDTRDE
ncbi:hypothetical protein [Burkholderia ubonensis]|uniref:hypothetical protein n=1 Tax=Burkholderia ubonensis TaxID=101571 RepID=UPI0012F96C83|nr:hypothetical protein [Burkholderia ubonensis]